VTIGIAIDSSRLLRRLAKLEEKWTAVATLASRRPLVRDCRCLIEVRVTSARSPVVLFAIVAPRLLPDLR
jgi:hypothetical protein